MWSSYFSLFPQVIKSALQVFMSLLQYGVIRLRMLLQPLPTKMRTSENLTMPPAIILVYTAKSKLNAVHTIK